MEGIEGIKAMEEIEGIAGIEAIEAMQEIEGVAGMGAIEAMEGMKWITGDTLYPFNPFIAFIASVASIASIAFASLTSQERLSISFPCNVLYHILGIADAAKNIFASCWWLR